MKSATIFGGGSKDRTTKEYIETEKIGELLAQSGYKVKSGGYYGIMEAISKGSSEAGGISIGFTCKTFPSTKGNTFLSKTIVCDDIYDRLRSLIESSDLFIVQRGGIGTLSELFLTMDVIRKLKNKPKILLIGEFWKKIMLEISPLLNKDENDIYIIIEDFNEIKKYL